MLILKNKPLGNKRGFFIQVNIIKIKLKKRKIL